jgi:DnaJ-class molecular chaperone
VSALPWTRPCPAPPYRHSLDSTRRRRWHDAPHQSGQQFRIRGKGAPDLRTGARGDQVVTVWVVVPTELTPRQRQLFEELAETLERPDVHETRRRGFFEKLREVLGV